MANIGYNARGLVAFQSATQLLVGLLTAPGLASLDCWLRILEVQVGLSRSVCVGIWTWKLFVKSSSEVTFAYHMRQPVEHTKHVIRL